MDKDFKRSLLADERNFAPGPEDNAVALVPSKADPDELAIAEKEAATSGYTYTHTFKTPVSYNGKTIDEIVFDWGKLTGNDGLAIENEMAAQGKMLIVPAFSGEYLVRLAARAGKPTVGADFFREIPLPEYNRIRSAARSFLLKSE